ncbi:P1 family peptidase [Actinocrispum wychmicini]|uniref:L-aminopeptidase/D-esterase-like protein n=1 Tax=Actinocrispum wychmicini TaxID=1213861 RepID=A0A4R2JZ35_9PSEU|nr:P1 family peptidase [Actinocrispum wychmicini]TCO62549.1 L-aminopeptidase/D-esterase-like protein [Actinocrispum wychmicini]
MNAITDVQGLLVGHHHRIGDGWATGTTVVLTPPQTVGAVDSRGGAPGTRDTDALLPENLVQHVNAICLTGGSAYGLAAADGVMRWLEEHKSGLPVGEMDHQVVPIVPSAVLFDLPMNAWGHRPTAEFGYEACEAAVREIPMGSVGAGTGARVGSLKGGVGTASAQVDEFTVGALAVANAVGEAVDARSGVPFGADFEQDGEFGPWPHRAAELPNIPRRRLNTTIGVVAVDARLSKAEAKRLAVAAHDGLARSVRPAHSMFDGDTVFALATGAQELPEPRPFALDRLCTAAADTFARAMVHGVLAARTLGELPAYRDIWP